MRECESTTIPLSSKLPICSMDLVGVEGIVGVACVVRVVEVIGAVRVIELFKSFYEE